MLPILKAALSDIKAFAVTTTGKVVIVAVLGTAAAGGTGAVVYNANVQPAQSQARAAAMTTGATNMADSDISSTTTSPGSTASGTATDSTGNSTIDSAVSAGIQQINSAADEAVSKVQAAASSKASAISRPDVPSGYYYTPSGMHTGMAQSSSTPSSTSATSSGTSSAVSSSSSPAVSK